MTEPRAPGVEVLAIIPDRVHPARGCGRWLDLRTCDVRQSTKILRIPDG